MHKLNLDEFQPTSHSTSTPQPSAEATADINPMETSEHSSTPNDNSSTPNYIKPLVDESSRNDNNGNSSMKNKKVVPILAVIAVIAGVATGFGGFKLQSNSANGGALTPQSSNLDRVAQGQVNKGDIFGVQDEKTFKDSAEGYLEIGGLNGEGSHKLIREGGDSQTVYLTSSITDLDKFDGMEVKVWGETFQGQSAGWLMDVGRIQILNPEGTAPSEE